MRTLRFPAASRDQQPGPARGEGDLTASGVSKSDGGDASAFEGNKGTISDTPKRRDVGIGRYLYDRPQVWITLDKGKIPEATLKQVQSRLAACGQKRRRGMVAWWSGLPAVVPVLACIGRSFLWDWLERRSDGEHREKSGSESQQEALIRS